VLYEARSNTGIDRMKIINAAAKSVPQPHKVDLKNPDKTIVVQIAKVNDFIFNTVGLTLCLFSSARDYGYVHVVIKGVMTQYLLNRQNMSNSAVTYFTSYFLINF
jgi:hypothetical protein